VEEVASRKVSTFLVISTGVMECAGRSVIVWLATHTMRWRDILKVVSKERKVALTIGLRPIHRRL